MRVLMLSWEYTPHVVGGLGKHVVELVPPLIAEGVEVHLVTPRYGEGEAEEAIPGGNGQSRVYRVDAPGPTEDMSRMGLPDNFFMNCWRTNINLENRGNELFKQGGFDLIHAHDWLVSFSAVALKNTNHSPLISTIHATELGRNRGQLHEAMQHDIHNAEWWLTYESWRVITTTRFMAQEIVSNFQLPANKLDIIANGIDPTRFEQLAGRDLTAFRATLAAPNEPIIFFVGRLVPEKGAQVLIEAAPLILQEVPNARFVIAGTGGYRKAIEQRAQELGVAERVNFLGFISDEDRDKLYKVGSVAVFPSLYEPFGIVALEAMAANTPVVVSDTGGLSEVVQLHETGIKVYPDDPASLAWGITHTLQHPDWSSQRVDNARAVVYRDFLWPHIAEQTTAVYARTASEAQAQGWGRVPGK